MTGPPSALAGARGTVIRLEVVRPEGQPAYVLAVADLEQPAGQRVVAVLRAPQSRARVGMAVVVALVERDGDEPDLELRPA